MEEQQACVIDESTAFLCPTCGTSAFEVIGTQWGRDENDRPAEFLVMRCFDCLGLFYHHLSTLSPCRRPAEGEDKINLATDILGPLPDGVLDKAP